MWAYMGLRCTVDVYLDSLLRFLFKLFFGVKITLQSNTGIVKVEFDQKIFDL